MPVSDLAKTLAELVPASADLLRVEVGLVTAVDSTTGAVTVNLGGIVLSGLSSMYDYVAAVNDSVLVLRRGQWAFILGKPDAPARRPSSGTVTAVAAPNVTLSTAAGSKTMLWVGATPAVNDVMLIVWDAVATPFAVGKLSSTPAPPPLPTPAPAPPAPPTPTGPAPVTTGYRTFNAVASATWRVGDNWRTDTDDAIQGTFTGYGANNGAFFYGTAIKNTLAGVTVTRCRIRLNRDVGAGLSAAQNVHVQRHASNTRPAGNVTYSGTLTDVPVAAGQTLWADLPTSVGQALVNSGGGLGVTSTNPYLRLLGLSRDGASGQVRIDWQR